MCKILKLSPEFFRKALQFLDYIKISAFTNILYKRYSTVFLETDIFINNFFNFCLNYREERAQ